MTALFITALVFVGLGVATFVALQALEQRAAVRQAFGRLADFEMVTLRERDLRTPLAARTLAPLLGRLTQLGRRLTPVDYAARMRHKLVLAGRPAAEAADRYMAVRLLTVASVPLWAFLAYALRPVTALPPLMVFAVPAGLCVLAPDIVVRRWIEARQLEIQRALPDLLDMLTISVEAGLGFEQALDRTIARVPGALSEELRRMLGEVRAGASRADALRGLHERTQVAEVQSFVLAIIQADTFGISIGRVLRAQSDEMRVKRRQLAQERAQKAPVKLLFPMVLCIFPAIFVVVLGPGVINVYEQLITQ